MTGLLALSYQFEVTFTPVAGADPLGTGGFADVSGLDVEMDVSELPQGGVNDAVTQRVGRAKFSRLVLKRGMVYPPQGTVAPTFWRWWADTVSGVVPVRRYDVTVIVLRRSGADVPQDSVGIPVAKWIARRALPAKVVGPALNARSGEVAVEEVHLAHEGLRLASPT